MSVRSPCKGLCETGVINRVVRCVRCNRTIDEIQRWMSMSHAERLEVIEAIKERRKEQEG